jgi:hypothetical protein
VTSGWTTTSSVESPRTPHRVSSRLALPADCWTGRPASRGSAPATMIPRRGAGQLRIP